MFGKRVHEMSKPAIAVSLSVRCLVGVFLLHNPAATLAQLIQIGEPELVFSMDDFSSISNKHVDWMDVNSDGSKVAFSTNDRRPYIYQTDGEGGDPMLVGPTPPYTQTLRFSRDNTKLFLDHADLPANDWNIWQVNSDGSGAGVLIGGTDQQTFPCPVVVNGQDRIIYRKGWWPIDLWSADMTGGDRIRLTFEGNKSGPRASVDGTRVAYMSQTSAVQVDIFLMNSDGSEQHPITNDGLMTLEGYPALARNDQGQELVVYARTNPSTGREEVWVTDLPGAHREPLVAVENRDLHNVDYVPDDPISPYGAIYYSSKPPGPAVPELVSEVWRVAVIGPNNPPVCDADGPYTAECQGTTTDVGLDGTASSDPDDDPLTFLWTTDCPGGSFDDETSDMPVLTVDTLSGCGVNCNVMLAVDDGNGGADSCSATVSISDTQPPAVTCSATPLNDHRMMIEYSAEDACGEVTGSAVIETSCCPLPVVDGQIIKLNCADHAECKLDIDFEHDMFKIKTDEAALVVTATDECGNTATCEVELCIPDDDGDEDY